MYDYIKRIRSKVSSNPLAFNGHLVKFKIKPSKIDRLGTLGEQLTYWKGQKIYLPLKFREVLDANHYAQ
jgi:hypothetical protein